MKQQEILKKIGAILKELSEEHEYLQSQEDNLNDLELELFAANADFLSDHIEILRKISNHNHSAAHALPEHTGTEPEHIQEEREPIQLPVHAETEPPVMEEPLPEPPVSTLPPLARSVLLFDDEMIAPTPSAVQVQEPAPIEDSAPSVQEKAHKEEQTVQPEAEATAEPVVAEDTPAPEVTIEPVQQDFFSYMRDEAQTATPNHDFSISSSHSEPEIPVVLPVTLPHVKEDPVRSEPVEVLEQPVAAEEPVHVPPAVPEQQVAASIYQAPAVSAPEPEEHVLTLNQKLSAQLHGASTATAASTMQPQYITDLKSAINLNDKLLFVKDLFNGYSLAYSEAIELLNRCKSFTEADQFLKQNYANKNNWADKPTTTEKFYNLLHRRFPQ